MGFFEKKPIPGLPNEKGSSVYENDADKLAVMRRIKKEKGYDTNASNLNEIIESGETGDRYQVDELETKLINLEDEYWKLNNRADVIRYKKKLNQIVETENKIKKIKSELEDSLDGVTNDNTYEDKIKYLRSQEQILEYAKESAVTFSESTDTTLDHIDEIKKEINEIKTKLTERYGNQDIKTKDGQYLN